MPTPETVIAFILALGGGGGMAALIPVVVRAIRRTPARRPALTPTGATHEDIEAMRDTLRAEMRSGLDEIERGCERRQEDVMAKQDASHRELRDQAHKLELEITRAITRADTRLDALDERPTRSRR